MVSGEAETRTFSLMVVRQSIHPLRVKRDSLFRLKAA